MYSVQHVLWRGAMALSLVVVGGVGANVSYPTVAETKHDDAACREQAAYVLKANKVEKLQVLDVVVIKGIPPMPDEA
jgi:hypothetical protein